MKITTERFFSRQAASGLALGALLNFGAGCATRDTEALPVSSIPAGAHAELSTGESGITPVTFRIPRGRPLFLTVTKEGYDTASVELRPTKLNDRGKFELANTAALVAVNPSWSCRLVLFPVFLSLDLALASSWDHQPNPVKLTLVPHRPAVLACDPAKADPRTEPGAPAFFPTHPQLAVNSPSSHDQP